MQQNFYENLREKIKIIIQRALGGENGIRATLGFTQKELADRMGINRVTLSKIEGKRQQLSDTQCAAICSIIDDRVKENLSLFSNVSSVLLNHEMQKQGQKKIFSAYGHWDMSGIWLNSFKDAKKSSLRYIWQSEPAYICWQHLLLRYYVYFDASALLAAANPNTDFSQLFQMMSLGARKGVIARHSATEVFEIFENYDLEAEYRPGDKIDKVGAQAWFTTQSLYANGIVGQSEKISERVAQMQIQKCVPGYEVFREESFNDVTEEKALIHMMNEYRASNRTALITADTIVAEYVFEGLSQKDTLSDFVIILYVPYQGSTTGNCGEFKIWEPKKKKNGGKKDGQRKV